ncbi:hypothetical protein KW792_01310, partial [Candidatus Saccharibacteria bacterium]|nr:hypothetical protein [Candidatus Saccharibacteria bacterium]
GLDLVNKECVFEGNPRSIKQAEWWLGQQSGGRLKITGLIHMVADPKVAEDRMIKRGRLDDHDDNVIETRFNEYQRSVQPTLDFLIKNGVKVHTINADKSIKAVAADIHKELNI